MRRGIGAAGREGAVGGGTRPSGVAAWAKVGAISTVWLWRKSSVSRTGARSLERNTNVGLRQRIGVAGGSDQVDIALILDGVVAVRKLPPPVGEGPRAERLLPVEMRGLEEGLQVAAFLWCGVAEHGRANEVARFGVQADVRIGAHRRGGGYRFLEQFGGLDRGDAVVGRVGQDQHCCRGRG